MPNTSGIGVFLFMTEKELIKINGLYEWIIEHSYGEKLNRIEIEYKIEPGDYSYFVEIEFNLYNYKNISLSKYHYHT